MFPASMVLNSISIVVFNRKAFKANTMGFYYTAISVIDILLAISAFVYYYSVTINQDVSLISNFSCVFITYSNRTMTLQMSSWANVLVTFDRLLCVTYRNKFAFMKKKRNLFLGFIILFVVLTILDIPNFLFKVVTVESSTIQNATFSNGTQNNIIIINNEKVCTASKNIVYIRDTISMILRYILPFALMILLNTLLIKRLIKSKQIANRQLKKEYSFAFTVVFLNAFFVITLLPSALILIGSNIVGYKDTTTVSYKTTAIMNFAYVVGQYFSGFNYTFTLLLNLQFNRLFRKEFIKMILDIKMFTLKRRKLFSSKITSNNLNKESSKQENKQAT